MKLILLHSCCNDYNFNTQVILNSLTKSTHLRRLVSRRLSSWRDGNIDILIDEFERCVKRYSLSSTKMDEAHIVKVFTRLMWRGQVRAAVRWMTER